MAGLEVSVAVSGAPGPVWMAPQRLCTGLTEFDRYPANRRKRGLRKLDAFAFLASRIVVVSTEALGLKYCA